MSLDLTIQPECRQWADRVRARPEGELLGRSLGEWRAITRRELGLAADEPVIATGHQTMLWHPGILVKFMLVEAVATAHGLARANLIVDQHAVTRAGSGDFGGFDIPVRRSDDTLAIRRIELTRPRPDVPMALHHAFTPSDPPGELRAALPSIADGAARMHAAVAAHADAPNAAFQMGAALQDLMTPWFKPAPAVTATELIETSLSRAILEAMRADPERCARTYNEAVSSLPEAGIGQLLIRDDWIELPVWRIRDDERRMHGYDHDVERALTERDRAPALLPRALFMTALIRLGMCDLFVHGTGGANYDRAMERWIRAWLGVETAPIAVATATLRLPLLHENAESTDASTAIAAARRAWHDPESPDRAETGAGREKPGPVKRELLAAVARAAEGSPARRAAFFAMHSQLATLRSVHVGRVERLQRDATTARRHAADAEIAARRDWAFPLYPREQLDELAEAVRAAVTPTGCPGPAG